MQDLTETRSLKHVFSAEDHLKNCDEMARLMDSQGAMEQTHKEIKAGLKQEEEALASNVGRYLGFVRDKYEYRKTPCKWFWDTPTPGIKTLYRIDTWESVDVRPMEDYERQQLLKFMEENPQSEPVAVQADMSDWNKGETDPAATAIDALVDAASGERQTLGDLYDETVESARVKTVPDSTVFPVDAAATGKKRRR